MRRRSASGIAIPALAFWLCLGGVSTSAEKATIHLVPARDVNVAMMLLLAKGAREPVLLFEPGDSALAQEAVSEFKANVVCTHGPEASSTTVSLMEEIAGRRCEIVTDLLDFARKLWPEARAAIAVRADRYSWMLRASAFAGLTGSALLPMPADRDLELSDLNGWQLETLYVTRQLPVAKTPDADDWPRVVALSTPEEVRAQLLPILGDEPVKTIVIANPKDRRGIFSPTYLSLLAPLISLVHRAPLFLANGPEPEANERDVLQALDALPLRPTHVILVGDELALQSHRVPDPVLEAGGPEARGGGTVVRVELFSQIQREQPQEFAVGRIVAESPTQASIALARRLHGKKPKKPRPVIFLTNADEVFALGETISRTTIGELRNVGVPVRAYFRDAITPEVIRGALAKTDLLVWEGHPRDLTLEERGGIAAEVAPEVVVLQGCYTLDRSDPFILIEKGTEAVVATSAAIYSAPGSAFARALFDAILYDSADLGTAVRNARNYLLALAQLQRLRNHEEWHKTYRAALAFALWGDPTMHAPVQPGRATVKPATWTREDDALGLTIPPGRLAASTVDGYSVRPVPRAMLGGLVLKAKASKKRQLKELHYTVQSGVTDAKAACAPTYGWHVVSLYEPRTETLTVLARPDWLALEIPERRGTFQFPLVREASECPTFSAPVEDESEPVQSGTAVPATPAKNAQRKG